MAEKKPKLFNSERLEEALCIVREALEQTISYPKSAEERAALITSTGRIVAAIMCRGRI